MKIPSEEKRIDRRSALQKIAGVVSDPVGATRDAMLEIGVLNEEKAKAYLGDRYSLLQTIPESALCSFAMGVMNVMAQKFMGAETGNPRTSGFQKAMETDPVKVLTGMCLISPVLEELAFRHLPAAVLDHLDCSRTGAKIEEVTQKMRMKAALVSSGIFAACHFESVASAVECNPRKMPLVQFAQGIYFWYLMRQRGMQHSTIAHLTNNAFVGASLLAQQLMKSPK